MVLEKLRSGKTAFVCEACLLAYPSREWAERCEAFCKKNNACSTEIIRHALP